MAKKKPAKPQKLRTKIVKAKIDGDLHRRIKSRAASRGLSIQDLIIYLFNHWLDTYQQRVR